MYYVGNYVLSASTFCPLWGSRVSGLHGPVPLTPPAAQKIPAEQKSQDRHVYRHILPAMTKDAQGINTPLKSRRQSGSKWHHTWVLGSGKWGPGPDWDSTEWRPGPPETTQRVGLLLRDHKGPKQSNSGDDNGTMPSIASIIE